MKVKLKLDEVIHDINKNLSDAIYQGELNFTGKRLLDTTVFPKGLRNFIESNYTDNVVITNDEYTEEELFETSIIGHNIKPDRVMLYSKRLVAKLFKFSELDRYYKTKLRFEQPKVDKNNYWYKFFATEHYVFIQAILGKYGLGSFDAYVFKVNSDKTLFIPDFCKDIVELEIDRNDVLDTALTRKWIVESL
jgi:hypothetical protein